MCTTIIININSELTIERHASTRQNVPERPMPALQWTIGGPASASKAPDFCTVSKKSRNAIGEDGTPKSGQVM